MSAPRGIVILTLTDNYPNKGSRHPIESFGYDYPIEESGAPDNAGAWVWYPYGAMKGHWVEETPEQIDRLIDEAQDRDPIERMAELFALQWDSR